MTSVGLAHTFMVQRRVASMNTLLSDWTKSTMGHAGGSDWLPGLCM